MLRLVLHGLCLPVQDENENVAELEEEAKKCGAGSEEEMLCKGHQDADEANGASRLQGRES